MKLKSLALAAALSVSSSVVANAELELPTAQSTNMGVLVEILDAFTVSNGQISADVRITNNSTEDVRLAENPAFTMVLTGDGRQLPLMASASNPTLRVPEGKAVLARLSFAGTSGQLSDDVTFVFNANKERDDSAPLVEFNNVILR